MNKQKELKEQQAFDRSNQEAYHRVFDLLEGKPELVLDDGFSQKIIKQIEKKERIRHVRILILFSLAGIFCMISTIGLLYYFLGAENLSRLSDLTVWATFAGLVIVIIQYLDRRLIKRRKLDWMI